MADEKCEERYDVYLSVYAVDKTNTIVSEHRVKLYCDLILLLTNLQTMLGVLQPGKANWTGGAKISEVNSGS
jgi:nitrous oxide reductase